MLTAWDLQAITGPRPTGLGYSVHLLLDAYTQYGGADGGLAEVVELRPNATDTALHGVPDRLAWEQWRLPRLVGAQITRSAQDKSEERGAGAPLSSPALLYCPALGAPLRCPIPRVAHVHDLIPLADPRQFTGLAHAYWTRLLPACWKRCAAVTVSNASLVDEVADRLGYPRERIHVVPYYAAVPVAAAFQPPDNDGDKNVAATGEGSPYFLTLASHEPRKNIALAISALAELARRGNRPRLVCAGGHTAHTAELQALAARLGVAEQIEWPGYTDRAGTLALLSGATALLFVSKLEGYGIPPQEAQALGTPVVLSSIACHRAVYDDPARWQQVDTALHTPPPFTDTDNSSGLAELMQRLQEDSAWRQRLSTAGLAYQRTFSPHETGQALRRAFEAVLE